MDGTNSQDSAPLAEREARRLYYAGDLAGEVQCLAEASALLVDGVCASESEVTEHVAEALRFAMALLRNHTELLAALIERRAPRWNVAMDARNFAEAADWAAANVVDRISNPPWVKRDGPLAAE